MMSDVFASSDVFAMSDVFASFIGYRFCDFSRLRLSIFAHSHVFSRVGALIFSHKAVVLEESLFFPSFMANCFGRRAYQKRVSASISHRNVGGGRIAAAPRCEAARGFL
jgi:hypothetical protein